MILNSISALPFTLKLMLATGATVWVITTIHVTIDILRPFIKWFQKRR